MNEMRKDDRGRDLFPLVCLAADFAAELSRHCNYFTGVPDSMFRKILPLLDPYVPMPRENHALAMAFGLRLGGKRPCLLIQNSGLGLLGDALFGLHHLYKAGVVMVVTWRGELAWEEPQHHHWGEKTREFLSALNVKSFDLQEMGLETVHQAATYAYEINQPAAILVHRGNVDE
jgi:sulfopyruvate decarboxylase TPP-binding subunit